MACPACMLICARRIAGPPLAQARGPSSELHHQRGSTVSSDCMPQSPNPTEAEERQGQRRAGPSSGMAFTAGTTRSMLASLPAIRNARIRGPCGALEMCCTCWLSSNSLPRPPHLFFAF